MKINFPSTVTIENKYIKLIVVIKLRYLIQRLREGPDLQVIFAMAESAVICRSAAILLATKSGHEVPLANAVNAMT